VPALEVDGVRLHYEEAGVGEAVVLLHGFTSSYVENWVETGWVRRLLGDGFRVVGLDARGHGKSTKLYTSVGYETSVLARDVVALLDRLRIDRAHAVGFSMGAGIALQLAMEHPARVGAVVVTGIGLVSPVGIGTGVAASSGADVGVPSRAPKSSIERGPTRHSAGSGETGNASGVPSCARAVRRTIAHVRRIRMPRRNA
jgi:pimeloyl-ACP methyl ester carboxylesterase